MDFEQERGEYSGLYGREYVVAFLQGFQDQEPQTTLKSRLDDPVVFQDVLALIGGYGNYHEKKLSSTKALYTAAHSIQRITAIVLYFSY